MFNDAFESKNVDEILYHHKLTSYAPTYPYHVYLPSSIGLTLNRVYESKQIQSLD
jgi:hypothetical protein